MVRENPTVSLAGLTLNSYVGLYIFCFQPGKSNGCNTHGGCVPAIKIAFASLLFVFRKNALGSVCLSSEARISLFQREALAWSGISATNPSLVLQAKNNTQICPSIWLSHGPWKPQSLCLFGIPWLEASASTHLRSWFLVQPFSLSFL